MWQTLGEKGILIHGFQLSLLNYFFKVKEMNREGGQIFQIEMIL